MRHGEEVTCLPNAQCPKRRGDYPSPPTLGLEFPVAFNESEVRIQNLKLVNTLPITDAMSTTGYAYALCSSQNVITGKLLV
ncbi:MAG: hypothetical protein V7L04_29335 [Nostoc sp.]|uniref:hypothetical protein n=1 Tax=Nostoc sp. TaxID=1180 RepID=UPI002FF8D979